ncbi:MAG: hypothetical protein OXL68_02870 [Paracoccaceae bacterium]|nr:hypothetical protein [Paracoccaceae bacterium]
MTSSNTHWMERGVRAQDWLPATGTVELFQHGRFLKALDDYDIVLTRPQGRA